MADLNNDGIVDDKDVEIAKTTATKALSDAKDKAKEAYERAQSAGFFSHFTDYNAELFNMFARFSGGDFKSQLETMKGDALDTLQMKPKEPAGGFVLYNALALWFGIAESIIFGIFGHGFLSLLWNGALGYCIAYTMYWTMTCYKEPKLRFYTLCFLALYIVFNVYMTLHTLIYVLPAALYGTKAAIDVLQFICGLELYKEVNGGALTPPTALL